MGQVVAAPVKAWRPRRGEVAAALAGLVIAACLAFCLPRYSLWSDEAATGLFMRLPLGGLLAQLATSPESESAQPLYYLLLWPWIRAAGESEVSLRLLSWCCVLLTVPVLWSCLRLCRLDRSTAWVGAVSFLALPVVMWYSLEARPYALIMLCASLHLREALLAQQQRRRPLWRLAALTLLVALAYSVAGAAALAALFVVSLRRRADPGHLEGNAPRRSWQVVPAVTLCGLAGAVVLTSAARTGHLSVPEQRTAVSSLAYSGNELLLGRSVGFSVPELRQAELGSLSSLLADDRGQLLVAAILGVGLAGLVLVGLAHLRWREDRSALAAALPWLFTAVLFAAFAAARGIPLLGRHLLFALPALLVLVLIGVARASPRLRAAALCLVGTAGLVALFGLLFDPRYAKDDYRAAGQLLRACSLPPAVVFGVDDLPPRALQYYGIADAAGSLAEGLGFLEARGPRPGALVVNLQRLGEHGESLGALTDASWSERRVPGLVLLANRPLDGCGADRA